MSRDAPVMVASGVDSKILIRDGFRYHLNRARTNVGKRDAGPP